MNRKALFTFAVLALTVCTALVWFQISEQQSPSDASAKMPGLSFGRGNTSSKAPAQIETPHRGLAAAAHVTAPKFSSPKTINFIPGLGILLIEALKEIEGKNYPEITAKQIVQISEAASMCAARWNGQQKNNRELGKTIMDSTADPNVAIVTDVRGSTRQFDSCPGFDVKALPAIENLLEQAVRAGEPEAMAHTLYAGSVMSPLVFGNPETLEQTLRDLGARRQDIAIKMIDAGYKEGLLAMSDMYEEGRFLRQNTQEAYAYLSAYVTSAQRQGTRRPSPTELPLDFYEKKLRDYRLQLNQIELARADRSASDIYLRCCQR
jgi:hypothetical protein